MKNLKLSAIIIIMFNITLNLNAQVTSDSVYIISKTDDMSGKTYTYMNKGMLIINETQTIGFKLSPYIKNDLSMPMITAKIIGIGSCHETDEIIILFTDGQKITTKSWNKFNCDGDAYFNMSSKDIELLRKNPISKIRIRNGRSFESYTGEPKDGEYFIKMIYQLDNKITHNQ